jgi:hypothetical protein
VPSPLSGAPAAPSQAGADGSDMCCRTAVHGPLTSPAARYRDRNVAGLARARPGRRLPRFEWRGGRYVGLTYRLSR